MSSESSWPSTRGVAADDGDVGADSQIQELKRLLEASRRVGTVLRNLSADSSALAGQAHLDAVSRHLAAALNVDVVFVGALCPPGDEVEVVGGWANGGPIGSLRYRLRGTPCEGVVGKRFCAYESGVQNAFPEDHLLVDMGINGYAGAPIFDKSGAPMGILVALHSQPLEAASAIIEVFDAFVGSVAAEMERARAQHALHVSEARFRAIVEHIPGAVYECELDSPWRVTHMSQGVEPLTGRETADFTSGRVTWAEIICPEDLPAVADAGAAGIRAGQPYAIEYRILRPDGSVQWVHERGRCGRDRDGTPACLRGVILDVGARKHAEEQQDRLQTQLLQAQKLEAVGRLAGGIAHDFNNMLNVILGHAELARETLDEGAPARESLGEIQSAAVRAANLTRQLLAFARRQTVTPRVIDLNQAVAHLVGMLRRLIGEDVALDWVPSPSSLSVSIDPTQLDQILANLCVNARDAISGFGHVVISTCSRTLCSDECVDRPGTVPGDYVEMAVSDDGCGIAPDDLDKVFDPFYTTKPVGKGTGLGLATVYGIVKQNRGAVLVESAVGRGTTFRILLPRLPSEPEAVEPALTIDAMSPRGHETVLVVEDEPAILDLMGLILEGHGYRVLKAAGPQEALALASDASQPIDLLVTDVVMPHMTGRTLAESLTRLRPGLRHLFVSGYPADVVAQQAIVTGGMHFLQKPFAAGALCAKVREALEPESRD